MLADALIRGNRRRVPKALHLTQGLGGRMEVLGLRTPREMAAAMVDDIHKRRAAGTPYRSMAVLVRTFAQTPPVEQAFVAADIPYSILGQQPFYKRPEVQTLIDYCRVAYLDSQLTAGRLSERGADRPVPPLVGGDLRAAGAGHRATSVARAVVETSLIQQKPIYLTLFNAGANQEPMVQEQMHELGATLQWLAGAFRNGPLSNRSAYDVLLELDERLGYSVVFAASLRRIGDGRRRGGDGASTAGVCAGAGHAVHVPGQCAAAGRAACGRRARRPATKP